MMRQLLSMCLRIFITRFIGSNPVVIEPKELTYGFHVEQHLLVEKTIPKHICFIYQ